jgi:hypothetical protein
VKNFCLERSSERKSQIIIHLTFSIIGSRQNIKIRNLFIFRLHHRGYLLLTISPFCKGLSPQPITAAPYKGQIEAVDHCPGLRAPTYMSPP